MLKKKAAEEITKDHAKHEDEDARAMAVVYFKQRRTTLLVEHAKIRKEIEKVEKHCKPLPESVAGSPIVRVPMD